MPPYLTITFMPEAKVIDWYVDVDCFYVMEDGYEVNVSTWPAWCNQCKEFVDGEVIPSLESLQDWVHSKENGDYAREREERYGAANREFARKWGNHLSKADHERIDREEREREERALLHDRRKCEWRMLRQSPPRCLQCGETDIVQFLHWKDVPSPCTDGTVRIEQVGYYRGSSLKTLYTVEGELIRSQSSDDCRFRSNPRFRSD
jgi:hypothetical protein